METFTVTSKELQHQLKNLAKENKELTEYCKVLEESTRILRDNNRKYMEILTNFLKYRCTSLN